MKKYEMMLKDDDSISTENRQKYIMELKTLQQSLINHIQEKNKKIQEGIEKEFEEHYELNGKPFVTTIKLGDFLDEFSKLTGIEVNELDLQIFIDHLNDVDSPCKLALNISSGMYLDDEQHDQLFNYKGITLLNDSFNEIQADGHTLYEILRIDANEKVHQTINGNGRRDDFNNIMCKFDASSFAKIESNNFNSNFTWYPATLIREAVMNCADRDKSLKKKACIKVLTKEKKNQKSA